LPRDCREDEARAVLPEDRPLTESLAFFCDLPCSLLLWERPLLLAEVLFRDAEPELLLDELLLDEPLLDLLLPDAPREDDDRAPEEREEELLFLDLLLDFEGIGISFLYVCAMKRLAPQDAKRASKYPAALCVRTLCG
jgi:hypothetical protein